MFVRDSKEGTDGVVGEDGGRPRELEVMHDGT